MSNGRERESPAVESIYDALDRQDPDEALRLARRASQGDADDPVVRFLAGIALLELDRADEAVEELRCGVKLDPADAELSAHLALALFRACRFEESARETDRALGLDADFPDSQYVRALLHERAGRYDEADACYERAARQDSARFPLPCRLSRAEFDKQVSRAIERLPAPYRKHLDDVTIAVAEVPSEDVLLDDDPPLDPETLLGLFVGVSLDRRTFFSPGGELPPQILLFKRNLERLALDHEELTREIALTLYHELGHYLGMDEDEVTDPDFEAGARDLMEPKG